MEIITNKYFLLAFTFGIYALSRLLQKKTGLILLNPILISIAVIITALKTLDIPYDTYYEAGHYIDIWLSPCVVALGVPLYQQLEAIKKQFIPIMISQIVGCLVGLLSVVLIAKWLGANDVVALSLAPKSVTTPIAIQISSATGGIPALTVSSVVCTGIFGAVFGFGIMKLFGAKSAVGESLAVGTASHAVGTSRAMEISPRFAAYSSLGLSINGILTAIIAPSIIELLL